MHFIWVFVHRLTRGRPITFVLCALHVTIIPLVSFILYWCCFLLFVSLSSHSFFLCIFLTVSMIHPPDFFNMYFLLEA